MIRYVDKIVLKIEGQWRSLINQSFEFEYFEYINVYIDDNNLVFVTTDNTIRILDTNNKIIDIEHEVPVQDAVVFLNDLYILDTDGKLWSGNKKILHEYLPPIKMIYNMDNFFYLFDVDYRLWIKTGNVPFFWYFFL